MPATFEEVKKIFDEMIARNEKPTLTTVREALGGGSRSTIQPHLTRCFTEFFEALRDEPPTPMADIPNRDSIDVRWLPMNRLQTDPRYQRPLRPGTIDKLSRAFDEHACGIIIVSEREDQSWWILDGNHRTSVKRNLGHAFIKAEVLHHLPYWREAQIFVRCNVERGTVNKRDVFKANVIAQDATATTINRVLQQHGLTVDPQRRGKDSVAAVGALEIIIKTYGEGVLAQTMRQALLAWPDNGEAFHGMILHGLARFLHTYGAKVKRPRLTRILGAMVPTQLLSDARQFRVSTGGTLYTSVGRIIAERYNSRLHLEDRLNPADL